VTEGHGQLAAAQHTLDSLFLPSHSLVHLEMTAFFFLNAHFFRWVFPFSSTASKKGTPS